MGKLNRSEWLYSKLLHLYPTGYRRRFAEEMQQNFRDFQREYKQSGRTAASLWVGTSADLVVGAINQHIELIRSREMKASFDQSADTKSFYIGVGLMVPAGVFFLAAITSSLLHLPTLNNISYIGIRLLLFMVALIALPLLAVVINIIALLRSAVKDHQSVFAWSFIKQYFWTLAIVLIALGWVAFLFGHDTVGCAVQYLPQLKWQAFQRCNPIH